MNIIFFHNFQVYFSFCNLTPVITLLYFIRKGVYCKKKIYLQKDDIEKVEKWVNKTQKGKREKIEKSIAKLI